jgi:hypothetical protein
MQAETAMTMPVAVESARPSPCGYLGGRCAATMCVGIVPRSKRARLPCSDGGGIVGVMPARRPRGTSADLFAAAAARKVPQPETPLVAPQVAPIRHVLPKDLPRALAQLSDPELDKLLVAAIEEARRRGRMPSNLGVKSRDADQILHAATPTKSRVPHVIPTRRAADSRGISESRAA